MSCFLKRILPFTLTLIIGIALGSFFNLFRAARQGTAGTFRLESAYGTRDIAYGSGRGCSSRRRSSSAYSSSSYSTTIRSAEIYYQPKPTYTTTARKNYTEGDVTVRVTLAADGTVSTVEPLTRLPYGLTDEAVRAARQIRFNPATRDGSPVDEVKTITYSFNID
ncbi:MAG TPA: energy transducer TonB [Pyrinomonadaceae bacterium]|nr:energy transducer TonB [Pyrinomonadaceae bacterium]